MDDPVTGPNPARPPTTPPGRVGRGPMPALHLADCAAACRVGVAVPEDWFPNDTDPDSLRAAKRAVAICNSCPIQVTCLEYALAQNSELIGIWGGMRYRDRRRIKDERGLE